MFDYVNLISEVVCCIKYKDYYLTYMIRISQMLGTQNKFSMMKKRYIGDGMLT